MTLKPELNEDGSLKQSTFLPEQKLGNSKKVVEKPVKKVVENPVEKVIETPVEKHVFHAKHSKSHK